MKRRAKIFCNAMFILLALALLLISAPPAFAETDSRQIPDHSSRRLIAAQDRAACQVNLVQSGRLDLECVVRLVKQRRCDQVRYCAIYTLGEAADPRATEVLVVMLHSADSHARRAAAHSLGKIGDPRAVMPLIEVLCRANEPVAVQSEAASALGKLGDPRAKRILAYLSHHQSPWIQREASKALANLAGGSEMRVANR